MALFIVATPIGNKDDLGFRAKEVLESAEYLILEERKEGTQILRAHGITHRKMEFLNEHTTKEEVKVLAQLCKQHKVALITDCGTPSFCDPGWQLVQVCRQQGIETVAVPGASSLMGLISLASERLEQFYFRGFLSAENQRRQKDWEALTKQKSPIVIMDTPYRFEKTLTELTQHFPQRKILLVCNLTAENEQILEGKIKDILPLVKEKKSEFMILIYA